MIITVNIEQNKIDRSMKIMKKKKTITLTLIGLFIFLFGIIGLTYAYWQLTLTQEDENLVYTDCLKLTTSLTETGSFTLTDAYPMTNNELVNDFFPNQAPYHFTITNECDNEVPISINMESLTTQDPNLKDEYVDVILWSDEDAESKFEPETDEVLSHKGTRTEIGSVEETPSYKLTENKKNGSKIIAEAKEAYQLYKFKIGASETKQFNLLLFMDYDTPVSTSQDITNNANWAGKITLNNYEIPKVNMAGTEVELAESGDGLYEVPHDDLTSAGEDEGGILASDLEGWEQTEWRYAGSNPDNYVWFNCKASTSSGTDNCEKWRIIGFVNVKTSDGKIDQRLKIIRDESIGTYEWNSALTSDWTKSSLMKTLNDTYYYKKGALGLEESARDMIDNKISWNVVGWDSCGTLLDIYRYERGTTVYFTRPTEWNVDTTEDYETEKEDSTLFRSIALMYLSDYGYATSGGSKGRAVCLAEGLSNWKNDYADCGNNNWLKPSSGNIWTLTPFSAWITGINVHYVSSDGDVAYTTANYNYFDVKPVVYLTSNVKISGGTGALESPFELSTN